MMIPKIVLSSVIAPWMLTISPGGVDLAATTPSPANNHASASTTTIVSTAMNLSAMKPSTSSSQVSSLSSGSSSSSSMDNYLPRRLYPGTYQNYCGPTPEVQLSGGCAAHGWHGDDPADRVDEACRLHDISYCKCESEFLARQKAPHEDIPLLASMTALRFLVITKPTLERTVHIDPEYFKCVNKADRQLIATGIRVRGEMQRTGCSKDPSLAWFCNTGQGTLDMFEKVNLSIFLRDLDADDMDETLFGGRKRRQESLVKLEQQRQLDLEKELKNGRSVADAASSKSVKEDEEQILNRLIADLDTI